MRVNPTGGKRRNIEQETTEITETEMQTDAENSVSSVCSCSNYPCFFQSRGSASNSKGSTNLNRRCLLDPYSSPPGTKKTPRISLRRPKFCENVRTCVCTPNGCPICRPCVSIGPIGRWRAIIGERVPISTGALYAPPAAGSVAHAGKMQTPIPVLRLRLAFLFFNAAENVYEFYLFIIYVLFGIVKCKM